MSDAMRQFNEVIDLFDFDLTRDQFLSHLRLTCHAAVHSPKKKCTGQQFKKKTRDSQ
jgi:hypothetical protein